MWQRGNLRINITISILRQGYNFITVAHETPEGMQITKPLKFFYDNSNSRPALEHEISFTEESIISDKYISGVRYYSIGDMFALSLSAYRMFQNTFNQIPLKLSFPGIVELDIEYNHADVTGPENPPRSGDFFDFNSILSINEFNEYSINAKLLAETFDPFGDGEKVYTGDNNILVNTYINNSTDLIEYFCDEQFRLPIENYNIIPSFRSGVWNNKSILLNGNALVFNKELYYPSINFSSHKPAQSANYSGFSGDQVYIRSFYKRTPKNNGVLTIDGITLPELLTSAIKIDIKLPTQTGWMSLNKQYDVSTFTGIDGDGCLLSFADNKYTYSSGTFSTANSGFMVIIRITLSPQSPKISYIEMGGW